MNSNFVRMISRLLIVSVFSLGLPLQSAHAGIMGTDKVSATTQSQLGREKIRTFLEREDVLKGLKAQGIDAGSAKARVDALTDDEVQKVAGKIEKLPAGGEILGILFSVFIVLLVTDILGFTKVFPFTHSVR
jgi:hypothetical protein